MTKNHEDNGADHSATEIKTAIDVLTCGITTDCLDVFGHYTEILNSRYPNITAEESASLILHSLINLCMIAWSKLAANEESLLEIQQSFSDTLSNINVLDLYKKTDGKKNIFKNKEYN